MSARSELEPLTSSAAPTGSKGQPRPPGQEKDGDDEERREGSDKPVEEDDVALAPFSLTSISRPRLRRSEGDGGSDDEQHH